MLPESIYPRRRMLEVGDSLEESTIPLYNIMNQQNSSQRYVNLINVTTGQSSMDEFDFEEGRLKTLSDAQDYPITGGDYYIS